MRVAHVYNYLDPRVGGPPHVIAHLTHAQRARGDHPLIIGADVFKAPAEGLLREVFGAQPLPTRFELPSRAIFAPPSQALKERLREVDIAHIHSIWPTQGVSVARACRAVGVPYILSFHGHVRPEALAIKPLKKRLGLAALGYQAMIDGAARCHALSERERLDALTFGVHSPIDEVPNGVSHLTSPAPPREALPSALRSALGDAPYLLFLSRVHPPKGAHDLARAFINLAQSFPEHHLVLAGPDEDGGVALVKQITHEAGLEGRVHLPGFVAGEHKRALLAHATLFSLPSYHEGFSVAILEAMSAGCPVVISEGCHFPLVASERLGWVHAQGSAPLELALREALLNPDEAHHRAQRALEWVEINASWTRIAERFDGLYRLALR